MDEQEFEEILTYLSRSKYPETINTKDSRSNWRKKCRPFTNYKNRLYYNHKKYGALLVVKGVKNKKKIIETNHIQADDHHTGINKTLKKIISNYYWKTIAKDVQNFIKLECSSCIKQVLQVKKQQGNAKPHNEAVPTAKSSKKIVDKAIEQIRVDVIGAILEPGVSPSHDNNSSTFKCESSSTFKSEQSSEANIQPLILKDHIMSQCGLDVIGPLSETHKGKRFVAILTDCVTKWVEAKSLNEFTTEAVGEFLVDVMCRHGCIEEILSKYNNNFCTRLAEKVCSIIGVTMQMSNIPSQTNGYMDQYWYNNLLCGALIKYSNQNQYYWDIYLNQVILAYRTFNQKNQTWSPFQMMYDRAIRLPMLELPQPSESFPDEQEALLSHINNCVKALSCPTPQQSVTVHTERLNSSYTPANTCIISSQQQPSQVIGSYSQTGSNNNQISNSNLPIITTLGPNLQTTVHNNVPIPSAPNSNISVQSIPAVTNLTSHSIPTNNLNTHTIPVNSLGTATISTNALPPYTISANNVSNQNVATNNQIISTQAVNHVITSQASVTQSNAVHAQTHLSTQASSDTNSGHMVMIHTDGKAYADSYYVICPQ